MKILKLYIDNVENSVIEESFTDDGSSDSDVTEGEEYVDSTISLDIHFEDESGSEVEPLKQVYVNIKLDSGLIPKGINPEDAKIHSMMFSMCTKRHLFQVKY